MSLTLLATRFLAHEKDSRLSSSKHFAIPHLNFTLVHTSVRERLTQYYTRVCPAKLHATYEGNLTTIDRILRSYIEMGCSAEAMEQLNDELNGKYGEQLASAQHASLDAA